MFMRLLISLFVVFFALGCSTKKDKIEVLDKDKPTIEAKAYKLISFGKTRMAVPRKAKILLKDGEYAGNAGCNGMSGKYDINLDKKIVKFHAGMSTLMACPDMKLETKFRKYLQAVDSYEIRRNMMILKVGDTEVLNFMEQ